MKNIKHLTRVGLVLLAAIQTLPAFALEAKNYESSAWFNYHYLVLELYQM
jgi:hypothetical protein